MAEKKNRRASVQINVRLEPSEAALIKRVIPKGSSSGHGREPAGRLRPPARSPDANTRRGGRRSRIGPRNSEGAPGRAPHAQALLSSLEHDHARMDRPGCHAQTRRVAVSVYLASLADAAPLPRCPGVSTPCHALSAADDVQDCPKRRNHALRPAGEQARSAVRIQLGHDPSGRALPHRARLHRASA